MNTLDPFLCPVTGIFNVACGRQSCLPRAAIAGSLRVPAGMSVAAARRRVVPSAARLRRTVASDRWRIAGAILQQPLLPGRPVPHDHQ